MKYLQIDWNESAVEQLRRLWESGLTHTQIGNAMGITKSAVANKRIRLNLPMRDPDQLRNRKPHQPPPIRLNKHPRGMLCQPMLLADCPREALPCSWPLGEPRAPDFRYCDAACLPGKPYCADHCTLAYVPHQQHQETGAA